MIDGACSLKYEHALSKKRGGEFSRALSLSLFITKSEYHIDMECKEEWFYGLS
jgi:hypothetical protein